MKKTIIIMMSLFFCSSTMHGMNIFKKKPKNPEVPNLDLNSSQDKNSPLSSSSGISPLGSGTPKTPVKNKGELQKQVLMRKQSTDERSNENSSS